MLACAWRDRSRPGGQTEALAEVVNADAVRVLGGVNRVDGDLVRAVKTTATAVNCRSGIGGMRAIFGGSLTKVDVFSGRVISSPYSLMDDT